MRLFWVLLLIGAAILTGYDISTIKETPWTLNVMYFMIDAVVIVTAAIRLSDDDFD